MVVCSMACPTTTQAKSQSCYLPVTMGAKQVEIYLSCYTKPSPAAHSPVVVVPTVPTVPIMPQSPATPRQFPAAPGGTRRHPPICTVCRHRHSSSSRVSTACMQRLAVLLLFLSIYFIYSIYTVLSIFPARYV